MTETRKGITMDIADTILTANYKVYVADKLLPGHGLSYAGMELWFADQAVGVREALLSTWTARRTNLDVIEYFHRKEDDDLRHFGGWNERRREVYYGTGRLYMSGIPALDLLQVAIRSNNAAGNIKPYHALGNLEDTMRSLDGMSNVG